MLGVAMLFSACDGMFEDIYDNNKTLQPQEIVKDGEFFVDATSYTAWQYLDLSADNITFVSSDIENSTTETGVPSQWTIALHRYDVKTNNCTAAETNFSSISELQIALNANSKLLAQYTFEPDIFSTNKIIIDLSHMIDEGYLIYQEGCYNEVVSRWLNVDISVMPPIYTPSHKVYILHTAADEYYALYLVSFVDENAVKGYLTIKYQLLSVSQ